LKKINEGIQGASYRENSEQSNVVLAELTSKSGKGAVKKIQTPLPIKVEQRCARGGGDP